MTSQPMASAPDPASLAASSSWSTAPRQQGHLGAPLTEPGRDAATQAAGRSDHDCSHVGSPVACARMIRT